MKKALPLLLLLAAPALAGPRLFISFVGLPPGLAAPACAGAAKSSLDPSFSNARIQNGNGHAFNERFSVIVYCDLDVHQAYIIVGGNESSTTLPDVQSLKDQLKTRLIQLIPGARPL